MAGAPSAKTPAAERLESSASTTRMPLSTVSAPAPPAFLALTCRVAPPDRRMCRLRPGRRSARRRLLRSTRYRVRSRPPFDMNVPPPFAPGVWPPVISRTSPATGLACRSMVPELVNVVAPRIWPCTGPPSAMALKASSKRQILARAVERGRARTAQQSQGPVVGEGAGTAAQIRDRDAQRIAYPIAVGVGKVTEIERPVVDVIVDAGELHKASHRTVIDDSRIAEHGTIRQRSDGAVVGQHCRCRSSLAKRLRTANPSSDRRR